MVVLVSLFLAWVENYNLYSCRSLYFGSVSTLGVCCSSSRFLVSEYDRVDRFIR